MYKSEGLRLVVTIHVYTITKYHRSVLDRSQCYMYNIVNMYMYVGEGLELYT